MQYKVPQNVQIEDKILPFMTLRQLIICMVGGGFTYLIYLTLEFQPPVIWVPPVGILGLLTVAIAFLKIRDIPFIDFVLLLLERYLNETKRVWMKSSGDTFFASYSSNKNSNKSLTKKNQKKTSIQDAGQISKMLDQDRE
jgi:hypothetical protein